MSTPHTEGRVTFLEDGDANHWSMLAEDGPAGAPAQRRGAERAPSGQLPPPGGRWNKCDGIPIDILEAPETDAEAIAKKGFAEIVALRAQRDELQKQFDAYKFEQHQAAAVAQLSLAKQ